VEVLRLGSKIAGNNHGCCAIDVIQSLSAGPDELWSSQVTNGDSGTPITQNREALYLGPTNKDILLTRLKIGTFSNTTMPNHAFLVAITGAQLQYEGGKEWLAILKAQGFEFIRAIDNSVYSGPDPDNSRRYREPVYLFGLFRNIGKAALDDPFKPPKEWDELPECTATQRELYDALPLKFLTEKELREAGAPVMLSGTKGDIPREKQVELEPIPEPQTSPLLEPLTSE
jgi:hypothetical protein